MNSSKARRSPAKSCAQDGRIAAFSVERENAEQKSESARRLEKGMPFEIEDHVAFGALWQRCKSAPVFDWQLEINDLASALVSNCKAA